MNILLTGGTGYIGSHTAADLLAAGHQVTLYDNLANSRADVIDRLATLHGGPVSFVEGDVRDTVLLKKVLANGIEAVIHFAGLKAVGESVARPLDYYDANVAGTISLLHAMADSSVHRLVFSSSATVYGENNPVPYTEDMPMAATNPYGRSKQMVEMLLADLAASDPRWAVTRLRYFNPVGAHESGLIGEDPSGIPNNLMPFIAQVAVGIRPRLSVFGGDWPTSDGTGVRDYLHVMDLAEGHRLALEQLATASGLFTYNLGTGKGSSVLEMVRAFEAASGRSVPYTIVAKRPGDLAANWADASEAARILGWRTRRSLADMCRDTWRWQQYARSLTP